MPWRRHIAPDFEPDVSGGGRRSWRAGSGRETRASLHVSKYAGQSISPMSTDQDLSEPLLEADEIQGNILGGFNKDHQAVLPLYFNGDAASIQLVRRWIADLLGRITWLPEVIEYKMRRNKRIAAEGSEPRDMPRLWTAVAFSHPGLQKLADDAGQFEPVFHGGLPDATGRIGDPIVPGTPGHISQWLFGGRGAIPDSLLIIAGDIAKDVDTSVREILELAAKAGVSCPHYDVGHNLAHYLGPDSELGGHEHFGFKDGVSQPGIRGRISEMPDVYVTERTLPGTPDG